MEGNYPPGFYLPDRDQQENRHQPPPPQPPPQQQHHVAHYPFELPIPYHPTPHHQSDYVDDQPTRVFPLPHPGSMAPMFTPVYHDSGPVHSTSNPIHHTHHPQRPVAFGGHAVRFATTSANYATPITTHEPAMETSSNLPISTPGPVMESNTLPVSTCGASAVEQSLPATTTLEPSTESHVPATSTCEPVTGNNTLQVTTNNILPVASSNIVPVTSSNIVPVTSSNMVPVASGDVLPSTSGNTVPVASSNVVPVTCASSSTLQVASSNVAPATTTKVVPEHNIQPIKLHRPVSETSIRFVTFGKPQTESNKAKQLVTAPTSPKQVQSEDGSDQPGKILFFPSGSSEEPHLFAALNLKKTSPVNDLPSSLSLRSVPEDNVEGVVAKETIEIGVEYGPYHGVLIDEEQGWSKDSSWEICISGKIFFYIDGRSTWMSHVRCAQNEDEQNMEAYQYCGEIYFRTTKVIEPGSELRIFYKEDYGKCARIETRLNDLTFNEDSQKFQCSQCKELFISAKLLLRHVRCEHSTDKHNEMVPVLTWKKKRKKKFVAIEVNSKQPPSNAIPRVNDREESELKCGTCKKVFPSFGRLKAHELFHEKEKAKPVEDKATPPPAKQGKVKTPKMYECMDCNKGYKSLRSLSRHEREAHGYRCQFCWEQFSKKNDCVKHERTHQAFKESQSAGEEAEEPPPKAKPQGIQPTEPAPEELKDMLGRTTDYFKRLFKCRFCSKRYSARSTAARHEKEVHTGEGDFKCSYCPKVFATLSRLKDHLVLHKYVNMYRCALCPKSFASESALNNHQGEHTGLKPFKCDVCGRGFRTRKLALKHKRRIHQERPKRFICSTCNKGFADKSDLKVHERRHKGIRQYVCLECGKGFTSSTSLAAHTQAMHIKEKPFSCEICGKKFALNHQYNHHMAKHRLDGESREESIQNVPVPVPVFSGIPQQ